MDATQRREYMSRPKTLFLSTLGLLIILTAVYYFASSGIAQTAPVSSAQRSIHGQVVSQYGPVANARVRIAGDDKYTLTDRQGKYVLETGDAPLRSIKVTAGKDSWFNNGLRAFPMGQAEHIVLNPLPRDDRLDYRFIPPTTCAECHNRLARYWDRSKMAHTTSNPKVLDMYYGTDASGRQGIGPGYKRDNPTDDGNCITCHAPSVAESGFGSRDLKTALQSPRTEWDGISCDYCHKVRKVIKNPTRPSHMAPVLKRQTPVQGNTILVLGPYDDVVNSAMAAAYSPVFDQGRFCATCHSHFKKLAPGTNWDRSRVYTDSEWDGFGLRDDSFLPVQTTYQEWKQWQDQLPAEDSNKGKKCQDCHMSWRKEMLPYDNYVVDGSARNMWGTKRSPRNIRPHHFDGGTPTQLKTALAMEIEGDVSGKTLTVNVYITNTNGGHWVPTGETMRSVMLLVNAVDSSGKALEMIAGQRLPEWTGKGPAEAGNYAGLPGEVFARVLQDGDGNLHVPFWKATAVAFDTRIRPKTTATFEFKFALEDPEDEPTAEAQPIYRPVVKPLAQLKNWTVEDILITSSAW
jgi:hypothetical protein